MSDEKETPKATTEGPVAPAPAPRPRTSGGEVVLRTVWPSGSYTFTPEGGEPVTATRQGVRVSRAVADAAVESTKAKNVYTRLAVEEVK